MKQLPNGILYDPVHGRLLHLGADGMAHLLIETDPSFIEDVLDLDVGDLPDADFLQTAVVMESGWDLYRIRDDFDSANVLEHSETDGVRSAFHRVVDRPH